jgi:hypothetical protein
MNLRLACFTFTLVGLTTAVRLPAAAEEPPPFAAELSANWRTRLAPFVAPRALVAPFTESRTTPLKKRPVQVEGTVRILPERGLSLAYAQTRAPVVILDAKGLLLRHHDGREQSAPPEAESGLRLLHALLAFDLAALEKSYALVATETPDSGWSLSFTRRPDAAPEAAPYLELGLRGDATRLTGIRLAKTPSQKIEIELGVPQFDPTFTPAELARYFR